MDVGMMHQRLSLGVEDGDAADPAWISATSRTAVYGPVRTVVREGRSCEAPPIPINPKSIQDNFIPL
jgi:hypothetical protein